MAALNLAILRTASSGTGGAVCPVCDLSARAVKVVPLIFFARDCPVLNSEYFQPVSAGKNHSSSGVKVQGLTQNGHFDTWPSQRAGIRAPATGSQPAAKRCRARRR